MDTKKPDAKKDGQRGILFSMGLTYAMGTFNDNFFKQAGIFLAAGAGLESIQGIAATCFALPFVVFSAWAGWLADRLAKSRLVIWSKWLELAAMLAGVWTLVTLNWTGMVAVIFLMGLQSTLFSPALNGSVPENFAPTDVPRINALLKLATTGTILLGVGLSGMVLDIPPIPAAQSLTPDGDHGFGRLAVGCVAVLVSLVGVAAAWGIRRSVSPSGCNAPFPWRGPMDSVLHALEYRKKDKQLYLCLACEAFFYGISSFVVLCITNLGVNQLHFSYTVTGFLSVALMAGICLGSIAAGRQEAAVWRRFTFSAGTGMGLGFIASCLAPVLPVSVQLAYLVTVFVLVGICGGFYLIPLVSFIQIRAGDTEKGKVLGVSNFASFSGILLFGLLFACLGGITPSLLLAASGIFVLVFLCWAKYFLRRACPHIRNFSPLGLALRLVLSVRYRVTVRGMDALTIPGPVLFLPNHPALIDPVIIYSLTAEYAPRPLADERRMGGFLGSAARRLLRAILIPDIMTDGTAGRKGVEAGLMAVAEALKAGDSVLFYPAGKICRTGKEIIGGNSGTAAILRQIPGLRVVLVRTTGLWGSSFSFAAANKSPDFAPTLLRGLLTALSNVLLLTPRRNVLVEFVEADDLPRDGDRKILNPYLEGFYAVAERPAMSVPRFFWQRRTSGALPTHAGRREEGAVEVLAGTRDAVYGALRAIAVLDAEYPLDESMVLNSDLGLDSLSLMGVAAALEEIAGHSVTHLEGLVTVGDCLRAVAGRQSAGETADRPSPVPGSWFAEANGEALVVPRSARTIVDAFCALARRAPGRALLADRSGVRGRREIFMGALILARRFRALPGPRLGIMLPAAPAAVTAWLGALLAGKIPVFFNWTVGERNLRHCMDITGVRHVVSATQLLERLEREGSLVALPVEWLRLDALAASLTLREKIQGFLAARCTRNCDRYNVPETAAILFTSGSENMPKAVPLTHANLLTNAGDIVEILTLTSEDSILAMLPPFHSFGLMAGLVLPLALGMRAAFHPNPTESVLLAALTRDFALTLLASPPTFLAGILEKAKGTCWLDSLHFAFVGAEKCPEQVYRAFADQCPDAALCEGYGITECSPVVAANRPGAVEPGSIGHVLPSVTAALVREKDGSIRGRAEVGETGMLLVRGPSIFSGYLGDAPSPFVSFEGESWYRTGDLARMDDTGRLTFMGRLKRFVKIGGEMISLPQIETTLIDAFAARSDAPQEGSPLAVESTPEETSPEIVVFTPMAVNLADINAALKSAGFSPLYAVKRVIRLEAIPQLGSGKTDYRALQDMLPK